MAKFSVTVDQFTDYSATFLKPNVSTSDGLSHQTSPFLRPLSFGLEYRIVATVLHSVIFILGVLGNLVVVVVVKRSKPLWTPTYYYLVSLAIADLVTLFSAVPEAIMSYHLYEKQWVLGQAGCSLLIFGNFLGINVGSMSMLAFTVERYIAVCHPLMAKTVCTPARTRRVIFWIWALSFLYCSPWLGLTQTKPHPDFVVFDICDFRLSREQYIYIFTTDLLLFYLTPLGVAATLYSLIALKLLHRFKCRKVLANHSDENRQIEKVIKIRTTGTRSPWAVARRRKSEIVDKSHAKVSKMLAVVVLLFALSWLPFRGLLIHNTCAAKPYLNIWFLLFAKSAIFTNCSINPVLYSLMSRRFRNCCMKCFGRGPGKISRRPALRIKRQNL